MNDGVKFNLFEFHKMFDKDILMLYKGPFEKHILSVFTNYIDGILIKYPHLSKKIFSIFIELAQNIIYYSAEHKELGESSTGVGTLAIAELNDDYTFFTGNTVYSKNIIPFVERCQMINSLNRDELRNFKRKQLNLPSGPHDTANIGLIQVALAADGSIDFEFTNIDKEFAFISITVKVSKKQLTTA